MKQSLLSRISQLVTDGNLDDFRSAGYRLKQDREPFDRSIDPDKEPLTILPGNWQCYKPTIVFVDNSEYCLTSVISECEGLPQFKDYQLVGVYVPSGTDPDKVIALVDLFASKGAVLDGGQYVDQNCPSCNEATATSERLIRVGVDARVTMADPREEYCPVSLLATALSMVE